MDAFVMLQELLEQEQFELIFPERSISGQPDIRLVYLMNDAVESFLVFHNARMTGEYRPDYEGEISASMSFEDMEYILVVHQGDSVVTIFFEDLLTDVHLYNYGEIGHFWMKDYEYLRQLEYRLAIMRDKYDYLGGEYCTPEERKLAMLVDFPPLNYCCYPAVPEQYIVPRVEPWVPTEEAIAVMEKLAALDERYPEIIRLCARESAKVERKLWAQQEAESEENMRAAGIEVTELDEAEKEKFRAAVL